MCLAGTMTTLRRQSLVSRLRSIDRFMRGSAGAGESWGGRRGPSAVNNKRERPMLRLAEKKTSSLLGRSEQENENTCSG